MGFSIWSPAKKDKKDDETSAFNVGLLIPHVIMASAVPLEEATIKTIDVEDHRHSEVPEHRSEERFVTFVDPAELLANQIEILNSQINLLLGIFKPSTPETQEPQEPHPTIEVEDHHHSEVPEHHSEVPEHHSHPTRSPLVDRLTVARDRLTAKLNSALNAKAAFAKPFVNAGTRFASSKLESLNRRF